MPDEARQLRFVASGGIPNNPSLPVIVRSGVSVIVDDPGACERLFGSNGWHGSWRNGIFPYHHFHSNAHEVLGIVSGLTRVILGGSDGVELDLTAGDVVVLSAGTGHKREGSARNLLVVGAYPAGQENYDLRREELKQLNEVTVNVAAVALPEMDPVTGAGGPVATVWASAAGAKHA